MTAPTSHDPEPVEPEKVAAKPTTYMIFESADDGHTWYVIGQEQAHGQEGALKKLFPDGAPDRPTRAPTSDAAVVPAPCPPQWATVPVRSWQPKVKFVPPPEPRPTFVNATD